MLLLLSLLWCSAGADEARDAGRDAGGRGKDSYLDAFMESHASLTATGAGGPTASAAASAPQTQYNHQPQYNPQPQYGPPTPPQQPQYGPPTPPQQPQYGPPTPPQQPQYGPPTPPQQPQYGPLTPYGPAPVAATPVPFFEGLGAGLWSLLSQLPLPDFHTALKILLKVILIKGAVKVVSLLLAMLFIPKLEDILNMIGSIMEMGMDLEMDKDKEKPMKPGHHKPDHHDDDDDDDDGEAGDDNAAADSEDGQSDGARSRSGAARSRMLNALAARVDDASARVAAVLSDKSCAPGAQGWPRCSRDQTLGDAPPRKLKKKVVNKGAV